MAEQYKTLHAGKYYRDYLSHNIRPDGREFEEFRPVVINIGSLSTADGSAVVKIGHTTVACGIKAEICKPKPERADEGFIIPNIELPPLCSSKFRPGPPSESAQVMTQLVFNILENSQCVNFKELCLVKDKVAWCLFADIICMDFAGALNDACLIALIAALKSVSLPTVEYNPSLDGKQVDIAKRHPLTVHNIPVSSTFAVFEDKILLTDPTSEEENLCSGLITVVIKDDEICSVHKPGGSPLTDQQLSDCIKSSKKRASQVTDLINMALKDCQQKGANA